MKHRIDLTIKNIKRHSVNAGISKVLEIGCGTGENLKKIKELFNVPDAIGIEISAEAVVSSFKIDRFIWISGFE